MLRVPVQIYTEFKHAFGLPKYETAGAAAMDVRANEPVNVRPGETKLVPTGIFMAIPEGFEIQVRPRSGMSYKTKLRITNAPGTIDSDYRGELCIIVENTGEDELNFPLGERVAQIKLAHVPIAVWDTVMSKDDLGKTVRGEGGFGSTGRVENARAFSPDELITTKDTGLSIMVPRGSLGEEVEA